MTSRWKHDRPMSRTDFDRRFPDEGACARHLAKLRWPDGFTCPACGTCKGWELDTKPFTWECAGCHRQTSVTAGTVMHRSVTSRNSGGRMTSLTKFFAPCGRGLLASLAMSTPSIT